MFKAAVIILFMTAFLMRVLFIFQGGVSFHYDMARDAFAAKEIYEEWHFKILGPPTSTPGLYHGVFYYYLIAPFYLLGQGDPAVAAVFFALINSLVIVPVVLLAKDLFKSRKWAILAGFLFAVSFEATQYGPWLSNPAPAALTVAMFFLFLHFWQKGKSYGLYGAVLQAALSTQFQFFLIYLFFLIPVFGLIFKIKTTSKSKIISVLIAAFALSNFFIAGVKFKTFGQIFSGFLNITTSGAVDFRPQFAEGFLNYINKLTELFTLNFFPVSVFLGGILSLFVLYSIRHERLILFFIFSNIPIFLFGGHTNTYANVGLAVPAVLSLIFLVRILWKKSKPAAGIILILISVANIYTILKYNPDGQIMLVIPNDMNLKNELSLIDETYEIANGQNFSINTITLPLWTNTTWAYLYSWYGQKKYGYVPIFYGHDQIGLPGNDVMHKTDNPLPVTFLIAESSDGIPPRYYQEELDTENSKTKLTKEINYGSIKLQVRTPVNK